MAETISTKSLPRCDLLSLLEEKVNSRHDIDFDFLGELCDFRVRVNSEMGQIKLIFPEYTPHDEEHHLEHLFHLADKVLERKRLEKMNCAELFLLAVGIYGHDWGMSVSNNEKHFIITGELQDGLGNRDLWVLSDDVNRFKDYIRKENIDDLEEGWSKYVRITHACRSAEKIRRYFGPINRGISEAASKICEGHGITIEDLQNPRTYPTNQSVLGETVNLRALTTYLRLIDLLDLAENRTPYLIWKFVDPRNRRSKMEWAKHRALSQVTFPQYQEGRSILIDGSTDDQEVYAALEDLRVFCETQFQVVYLICVVNFGITTVIISSLIDQI